MKTIELSRLGKTVLRSAIVAVVAASLTAIANPVLALQDANGQHWSTWRAMGSGFAARKREAPPPSVKKFIKRQQSKLNARKGLLKGTSASALWLETQEEGLYSVSIADLAAQTGQKEKSLRNWAKKGRQLALTNGGSPTAWYFDKSTDAVYFVAEAIDTQYTRTNAYRLRKYNKGSETMGLVTGGGPVAGSPEGAFLETLKFEEENQDFVGTPPAGFDDGGYVVPWTVSDDPDADFWFWASLWGANEDWRTLDLPLDLPGVANVDGQGFISVALRGGTNLIGGNEHKVWMELNGTPIGSPVEFDAFEAVNLEATFNQDLLQANNVLTLKSESIGTTGSYQYLDQIEVSYWRMPVAQNDELWLHGLDAGTHTVSGLTTGDVTVVESPADTPKWRSDITVAAVGDGTFNVTFDAENPADYLVTGINAVKPPVFEVDEPSKLRTKGNRVDYLIIAPKELANTAEALRKYRRNQFRRTKIAWYKDILDEFSNGIVDPQAITDFLKYAKNNWRKAPSYVVLLGAGRSDHRDQMGYGETLIPLRMTTTQWGLAASDNRYMDIDGDELMDFAYGRITITDDDVEGPAYVAKLAQYESAGSLSNRAVLVADDPDNAGDFHANSDIVADVLSGFGYDVTKLYHPSSPSVRSQLTTSAMWDAAYSSYDGHGSRRQMGEQANFFNVDDVDNLSNTTLPLFSAFTCALGDDMVPGAISLASKLTLKSSGGVIASLAPTGLSYDRDAQIMGGYFNDALIGDRMTIGEAAKFAQQQSKGQVDSFMLHHYQVIGDPVVRVQ